MTASTAQRAAVQETSPLPLLFLDEESLPSLEEASCVLENRIMVARLILYLYALARRLKAELEREGEGWAAENASHRPVYFDGEMIDEHLARTDQAVQLAYLTDWRGSVMGVLPVNQPTVVNHYAYSLFGLFRDKTEQITQRYGFTGREFGEVHGLIYFRARSMNPSWGRFTQRDMQGGMATGNLYVYASNEPMSILDATGLAGTPIVFGEPRYERVVLTNAVGKHVYDLALAQLTRCGRTAHINFRDTGTALYAGKDQFGFIQVAELSEKELWSALSKGKISHEDLAKLLVYGMTQANRLNSLDFETTIFIGSQSFLYHAALPFKAMMAQSYDNKSPGLGWVTLLLRSFKGGSPQLQDVAVGSLVTHELTHIYRSSVHAAPGAGIEMDEDETQAISNEYNFLTW